MGEYRRVGQRDGVVSFVFGFLLPIRLVWIVVADTNELANAWCFAFCFLYYVLGFLLIPLIPLRLAWISVVVENAGEGGMASILAISRCYASLRWLAGIIIPRREQRWRNGSHVCVSGA